MCTGEAFERTEEEGLAAEEQQEDVSEIYASLHTSAYVSKRSLLNRGTASSSTSPLKKSKNQMVKVMQKIHATLENNCNIANKVMLGEHFGRSDQGNSIYDSSVWDKRRINWTLYGNTTI
jgi:hypothetical protein